MSERNGYIDVLKGWTILLVVIGHALQRADGFGPSVWPWHTIGGEIGPRVLATGSMPLFIAISGYLTFGRIRSPITAWITKKARLLLIPWASWTIVYYFLVRDRFVPTAMPAKSYFVSQALSPSLWYLVVLFLCCAALALGLQVGEWSLPLMGIAFSLSIVVLPQLGLFGWLIMLQTYYWWFLAGYFFARWESQLLPVRWAAWAVAVPVTLVGLFPLGTNGSVPSLIVMGLCAGLTNTLIAWGLHALPSTRRVFAYMGVRSLDIYVGQFLVIGLLIVRGPFNALIVGLLAVFGSLALGTLLRLSPVTNTLFLGGKDMPTAPSRPLRPSPEDNRTDYAA